jgi:hypothetical protein
MENTVDSGSEKQFTRLPMFLVPTFIDVNLLTSEQKDPDFRLKRLQGYFGGTHTITCSKCHHCR